MTEKMRLKPEVAVADEAPEAIEADVSKRNTPAQSVLIWGVRLIALSLFGLYAFGLWRLWQPLQALLPDELTLSLFGKSVTAHNLHQKAFDSGLVLLVILPSVLYLEAVIVGWKTSSIRRILFDRNDSIIMDIAGIVADQAMLMRVLSKIMTFGLSAAAGVWIHDQITRAAGFEVGLAALPYALQLPVCFVTYSFLDYWTHRFDHTKYMWPLHRYHHSTADFCVITSLRQHPGALTGIFIINTPMAILGAPVEVMITVNLIVTIIGLIIHSGIETQWGWFGRWVIQSPLHHRLHHRLDYRGQEGNYAIMPIWDRLFGTYYDPPARPIEIGVEETYRQGLWFWRDLIRDYADFWKGWGRLALNLGRRLSGRAPVNPGQPVA